MVPLPRGQALALGERTVIMGVINVTPDSFSDGGELFDPARHEAVGATADTDAPPGTVVRVVRPGYGEGERQLRPAAVVVAKRDE